MIPSIRFFLLSIDCQFLAAPRPPKEVADFCLPLGGLLSSEAPTQLPSLGGCDAAQSNSDGMSSYSDSYNHSRDLILKVHKDKTYHGSKRYSNDCFVFVLDDKTIKKRERAPCVESDLQVACPGSRMYGICVQQTRKMSVSVSSNSLSSSAHIDVQSALHASSQDQDQDQDDEPRIVTFESKVCFTFLTRFPFFDFFFEVIHQIIHLDEEDRWKESMTGGARKAAESYIPTTLLNEVIGRLIKLPAPHYGASLSFQVRLGRSVTVETQRFSLGVMKALKTAETTATVASSEPQTDCEHHHMSVVWSMSALLSPLAVPVELLVRCLGLMLCEAKMIILGTDLCVVSAAVTLLQTLLLPLEWVAPAISILPLKLIEFLECPVPLLAGLVVEPPDTQTPGQAQISLSNSNSPSSASSTRPPTSFHFSSVEVKAANNRLEMGVSSSSATTLRCAGLRAAKLLERCGEGMDGLESSEEGMLSAVLDTDEKELFLCGQRSSETSREQLVMPCAQLLVDRIKACLREVVGHPSIQTAHRGKAEKATEIEEEMRLVCKVQALVADHIRWMLSLCLADDAESRVTDSESAFILSTQRHVSATGVVHASTFEEVMSLALKESESKDEEGGEVE